MVNVDERADFILRRLLIVNLVHEVCVLVQSLTQALLILVVEAVSGLRPCWQRQLADVLLFVSTFVVFVEGSVVSQVILSKRQQIRFTLEMSLNLDELVTHFLW